MGKRSRCASPGSIRSPGVPRSCCQGIGRAGNTVQRRSSPSSAADAKPGFRSHDGVVTLGPCHAPFAALPVLGSSISGHRPERSRHRRDGPRPGPADPSWRGWSRLRRRGAARRRLRPGRARTCSSSSRGSRRRWRGRAGFRRGSTAGCRLRAAGPRALKSWSHKVRHPVGQRVTAVPRDHHKGLLRLEIGPGLMAASAQPWTEAACEGE